MRPSPAIFFRPPLIPPPFPDHPQAPTQPEREHFALQLASAAQTAAAKLNVSEYVPLGLFRILVMSVLNKPSFSGSMKCRQICIVISAAFSAHAFPKVPACHACPVFSLTAIPDTAIIKTDFFAKEGHPMTAQYRIVPAGSAASFAAI